MNKEKLNELREKILETSYWLTQSIINNDTNNISKMKAQLNELIDKYLIK